MRALLLVVAAVAVGVAVGLLVLERRELPPPDPEGAPGAAIRPRLSMEPREAVFAEPVTAEAEFVVDPGRVLPDSVRFDGGFAPFTQVSGRRTQTSAGDLVRVSYRFRLSCVTDACLPTGASGPLQIEPGRVSYTRRAARGEALPDVRAQDTVGWPVVTVLSRLGPDDVDRPRLRTSLADVPPASQRASPALLGALFLGGSVLLALLGAGLLATQLRGRRAPLAAEPAAPRLTPLERALAEVAASSVNGGDDDRRRSLERLARELSATGRIELAARARRLAWSPRSAAGADVDSLTADVRALLEEER